MSYRYITKENLLSLLHSFGLEMKRMCNPSAHPYDDERRAAEYPAKVQACRDAYAAIRDDHDPFPALRGLAETIVTGVEANMLRLIIGALQGRFEKPLEWFSSPNKGFHWVTFRGDFYGIDFGDDLNVPRVERVANKRMPKELVVLTGAKDIANRMPNPCTRVTRSILVS